MTQPKQAGIKSRKIRIFLTVIGTIATLSAGLVTAALAQDTAFGTGALQSNTTGADNSAFGFDALFASTTGLDNSASGFLALKNNTTGGFNTAIGDEALSSNTIGKRTRPAVSPRS
jgi:hypothetical protein